MTIRVGVLRRNLVADRAPMALGAQFAKYAGFGVVAALSDAALFAALVEGGMHRLLANTFSVGLGMSISFALNSRLTFRRLDHPALRILRFVTVGCCGLLLSSALLEVLVVAASVPLVAKALTLPVVALFQFTLNRQWTFREIGETAEAAPAAEVLAASAS